MGHNKLTIGFKYHFECFNRFGGLKWESFSNNLIPDQGREYIIEAAMRAGNQFSNWYIGLFTGAHTPDAADTMATIVGAATEAVNYSEPTRVQLVPDVAGDGLFVNGASPAIFTFPDEQETIIRGGFISSAPTKGGTTGVLLSVVLNGSPKPVSDGETLRVTAGLSLISV